MSASGDDDVARLVADLVSTLRELESEFEPRTERGFPRPPSPSELLRFTSDVGIPAAILVLRTNVEALKLLQRALRLADGRPPTRSGSVAEVRDHAERVGRTTLGRLDDALGELQDAVEGQPEDERARELLDDARELRSELSARLADASAAADRDRGDGDGDGRGGDERGGDGDDPPTSSREVPVDVDAELRSLKREVDRESPGDGVPDGAGEATDMGDDHDGGGAEDDGADGGGDADGDDDGDGDATGGV